MQVAPVAPVGGAVPPPPEPVEDEAERKKRRDLRAEAKSTRHLLTHKPFNPYCPGCLSGKMREKQHFKGSFKGDKLSGKLALLILLHLKLGVGY